MKKSLKAAAILAAAGVLVAGSAFSASAASICNGQWCQEATGWWYKLTADGSTFLANTWYWIKDTDGGVRCYYFDQNGWMVTNTTVDGCTIDENGHWVENGAVVSDATKDYATSIDFAQAAASQSTASSNEASPVAKASTKGTATAVKVKIRKSSGGGDNPGNATATIVYGNASISGASVSNDFGNFKMTLPGSVTAETSGSGTDWFYESEAGEIISSYLALDKYTAGNTDLGAFITKYLADKRGGYGFSNAGNKTLGAYSWIDLQKTYPTPEGNIVRHIYVRVVEGQNYVQTLHVEPTTKGTDFASNLSTIARIR